MPEDAAIQLQPDPQSSVVILKRHLDRLIFPPGHGIFMHHTVGTTPTPFPAISKAPGLNMINYTDFVKYEYYGNTLSSIVKHP